MKCYYLPIYFSSQTKYHILWISVSSLLSVLLYTESVHAAALSYHSGCSPESLTQAVALSLSPTPCLYMHLYQALVAPGPQSQLIRLSTTTGTFLSLVLRFSLQLSLQILFASCLLLGVYLFPEIQDLSEEFL